MKYLEDKDSEILLIATNLKKKYNKKNILNIKKFEIRNNDRIGIIGPNNCGKTILCELLTEIKKPNSGTIKYKKNIKFSFQNNEKESNKILSGYDFIKLYVNNYELDISAEKLHLMIDELDIWPVIKKPLSRLTISQKQKVEILLSLLIDPNIIVLDDIFVNIDEDTINKIFKILFKFLDSKIDSAFMFVSHNIDYIEKYCNKIMLMYNGRIIDIYSTKKIINDYKTVSNFIKTQFIEYKIIKNKEKIIKNDIDKYWAHKWEIENVRRKNRKNK